MDFLSRMKIFGERLLRRRQTGDPVPEYLSMLRLKEEMNSLLSGDHYVARSEYKDLFPSYQDTVMYFRVLQNSKMLKSFCAKNKIREREIVETIDCFEHLEDRINAANDLYIEQQLNSEKDYFDQILKDLDPSILLDEDQRRVVLTDEDYCLVVAGAGAGKTTTVAAKVKYLVERKGVNPRDILVISFTNKAVGELRDKINKGLKIDCPITTFHSAGNAILRINDPEPLNIYDGSKLYYHLQDYFKQSVLTNESLVENLILFFASYFEAPYEGADLKEFFNKTARANYTTMRSELDDYRREIVDARTKKHVTIQNEVLKSYQEVQIANFLYLNSIDYDYEPVYPYAMTFARKPYTPDFILRQGEHTAYLEHFGITEDGQNQRFTREELERYKKCVNDKVRLHRAHGTTLLYTFSAYKDKRSLPAHLKENLENAGFVLTPRSNAEIMTRLFSSEKSRYVQKLVNLICRFLTNFKTNGYHEDEFERMYHSTTNVRSRIFLDICQDCYLEYQRFLKENHAVDFQDMINESARVLRQVGEMREKLHFEYIIVDEYQDISRQRFDLTTALSEVCDGKIIAVGDDWQSIYAFSGSDLSLFTHFREKMGYAKQLKIVRTYRNAQEVIDIAGNFIQQNDSQIKKQLISPKTIEDPVIIYTYDNSYKQKGQDRKSGALYATANAVETALTQIIDYNRQEGKTEDGSILLLGRYGFDGDYLERSGLFEYQSRGNRLISVKYPELNITFMTVHMAKGLGYDNVIVVNGKNETYGFPSKIEDDPVLSFVIKGDHSIAYAEERRLFYVAMTRTKNRVYFIAPEQNPSEFLLEIRRNYKNVILKGTWNEDSVQPDTVKNVCPICGYPLQFRYKNSFGLKLFMCTNDQELCGFMTNDQKAGELAIMKCDKCRDGYLIAKNSANGYFLGCTNYKQDGTGCGNTISRKEYFTRINPKAKPASDSSESGRTERKPIPDDGESGKTESKSGLYVKPEEKSGLYIGKAHKPKEKPASSDEKAFTSEMKLTPDNREALKTEAKPASDSQEIQKTELNPASDSERAYKTKAFPSRKNKGNPPAAYPEGKKNTQEELLYKEYDFKELCKNILSCLNHISEDYYFESSVLTGVLKGDSCRQIEKHALNKVPEYGIYPDLSLEDLDAVICRMIDDHYILKTKAKYPVLHPTWQGNHFEETITKKQLQKWLQSVQSENRS